MVASSPPDFIALALSRLPHMYRGRDAAHPTNTEKAIRALLAPAPGLAAAMWAVLLLRSVDTAVGVQLEVVGALVGRPRNGVADDEIYRRYIRAQITANKSDGVREDLLTVARLVVDDAAAAIVTTNFGNGAVMYRVEGVSIAAAVAEVLAQLVGKATSDGVRSIIGYTTGPATSRMRWGTGTWGQNWSRARDTEQ